ncbi:helix-turn-helix domain-containing protein [Dyadobacter sandarakinus]|uniref:Helix-turn-helix transcriptional regulator n=1 Tax=Dyadobacter sandarakinus TaxID=2747268 RepID=A0ABX7I7Z4_9BACT|nr:helix-turn-helix domain-containing protein [Dyadobacter sandarakinus]QRR01672.1 helix-turn-helix transcriptional regulator [Dyadobacter sandarakinus]
MSISTENEYNDAFRKIDALIAGKFEESEAGRKEFLEVAKSIQEYEKRYYPIPKPETVIEMVELKMYERKITQKQLSALLEITTDKLSQILNGKREPDVSFLKAVYLKLGVDPGFLLRNV